MTDDNIELSRRKVLGSLGAIGVASAGAGLGTSAYFSDEESFVNNTLTAGELDLKVDWQEHYNGEPIEAYPDPNNDGVQEAFASEPGETIEYPEGDGGTVEVGYVCEDGADTPAGGEGHVDPTETLRTAVEGETYGSGPPLPLVYLDDVKPGDAGELTFGLHLCDNPGYLWMNGTLTENDENGLTEPEAEIDGTGGDPGEGNGELADAIEATVWYDSGTDGVWNPDEDSDEGDNVRQSEERLIARGTLRDVLSAFELDPGLPLDATLGTPANEEDPSQGEQEPPSSAPTVSGDGEASSKLRCTTVGGNPHCVDLGLLNAVKIDPPDSDTYTTEFGGTVEFTNNGDGTATITTDFPVSAVIMKGGPNARVCLADADEDSVALEDGDAVELDGATFQTPVNPQNDKLYGLSHAQLCYTPADGETPPPDENGERECFENSTTYHIGFAWELPAEVGNEVQSDSVGFDLGFYTEQCRHNDGTTQN